MPGGCHNSKSGDVGSEIALLAGNLAGGCGAVDIGVGSRLGSGVGLVVLGRRVDLRSGGKLGRTMGCFADAVADALVGGLGDRCCRCETIAVGSNRGAFRGLSSGPVVWASSGCVSADGGDAAVASGGMMQSEGCCVASAAGS